MKITQTLRFTLLVAFTILLSRGVALSQAPYATKVVAKKSFLNQTGAIASTTLYTPTASGNYRVSIYSDTQNPPDLNAMCPHFVWTDDFNSGQTNDGPGCLNTNPLTFGQGILVLHVKGGTTISVYTSTSYPEIPPYNLYVTIEKL
jgi:transcription elongation factor